jgi:hypothetical protein
MRGSREQMTFTSSSTHQRLITTRADDGDANGGEATRTRADEDERQKLHPTRMMRESTARHLQRAIECQPRGSTSLARPIRVAAPRCAHSRRASLLAWCIVSLRVILRAHSLPS